MTHVYGDDDADLSLVQERNVVVVGFDATARVHALCLRDSGVDLRIGVDAPGAVEAASADGLRAVPVAEACEEADLIAVPGPVVDPGPLRAALAESLVRGDVVVLGSDIAADQIVPAGDLDVDVVRVVPWEDPGDVRAQYELGRGVAALVSVLADGSGLAFDVALGYARGIGATRAGVLRVDDDQAERARRVADRTRHSAVLPALHAGFAELVDGGCPPEVAYLRCVRDLARFARALEAGDYDDELAAAGVPADERLRAAATLVRSLTSDRPTGPAPLD